MATLRVAGTAAGATAILIAADANDAILIKSYSISGAVAGWYECRLYFTNAAGTITKNIDDVSGTSVTHTVTSEIYSQAKNRNLVLDVDTASADVDIVVEYDIINSSGKDWNYAIDGPGVRRPD